ncbi:MULTISPECIES: AzlC family ABC transporter permease [unclassified Candidatus Frackibacter]|uniref:AzlC family ABC transporter permease n=2 Tax=Candidatus Frackibacter TaxID=2017975 RepID=UPI001C40936E|nr:MULTISPECIES: AzlC family ABC transporter permease [unclassified Candidatus Frackibacter]
MDIKMETADVKTNAAKDLSFFAGTKEGIPIALGYIPIAIAFGLLAKSVGLPNRISIIMSLLVFAGASQFVAVNLLALSSSSWEIILTTFIVNLRHLLMSASISQRIENRVTKGWRFLLSFGITDETFSIASLRPEEKLSPNFILGLNLISYSAWVGGTAIGVFLGAGLPKVVQNSMGIALYAMFIGLLIPNTRDSRQVFILVVLAMMINSLLNWVSLFNFLSAGWNIIITTIVAAMLGAIFFPEDGEE